MNYKTFFTTTTIIKKNYICKKLYKLIVCELRTFLKT
jgi:hypothetical protein